LRCSAEATVTLGQGVCLDDQVCLDVQGGRVEIEPGVRLGRNCLLLCRKGLYIGSGTVLDNNVTVMDTRPNFQQMQPGLAPESIPRITREVHIGPNCWIGTGAVILPGVRIEGGSVVAAGAVVTRNVPAGITVGGVPARFLKRLGQAAPAESPEGRPGLPPERPDRPGET
jgi:acetyltransferase-like isoleucine patch superfamily enzyme